MKPITLITGASAGIGLALADVFAERGHNLVLVSRRQAELNEIATRIVERHGVICLVFAADLVRSDAADAIELFMTEHGVEPQFVVNNAGFGVMGPADHDVQQQLAMVDLNIRIVCDLSLRFVRSIERHRGGIMNLSSLAAFFPGPGMAVYYASKSFVLSFTRALHRELAPRNIRVSVLCPGPVETELHSRAGIEVRGHVRLLRLTAQRVAKDGYEGLIAGKPLIIPGWPNKLIALLLPRLPVGLMMSLTRASAGLKKRQ